MPSIDRDYVIQLCQGLVRINSINPMLVADAPGEAEIAQFTAGVLAGLGLEVRTHEPEAGRVSVTGRLAGSGGGRSLMLNAHYDTVGVEGVAEPFSGAVRNGLDDVTLVDLFAWSEAEFHERLAGSAIHRIGYERWLRNLAVGLGNAPTSGAIIVALEARVNFESALVREHVSWAIRQHNGVHRKRGRTS